MTLGPDRRPGEILRERLTAALLVRRPRYGLPEVPRRAHRPRGCHGVIEPSGDSHHAADDVAAEPPIAVPPARRRAARPAAQTGRRGRGAGLEHGAATRARRDGWSAGHD